MNQLSINRNQKGAALVVSLVILIAMTLLGITSMKGTLTELSMAGNLRESALSFQAAEAGLRSAEALIEGSTSAAVLAANSAALDANNSNSGYVDEEVTDPDYLDTSSWEKARSVADTVSLAGVTTRPRFFIKYMGEWSNNPNADPNTGAGYGGQPPGEKSWNYRITSRGSGQTGRSFRTVQSYYGTQFKP